MTPKSRTGKLMQGLFGRFRKQDENVSPPSNPRLGYTETAGGVDNAIEFDEFPITSRFDDDEETNWDDVETLSDNNQVVYPQPIATPQPAPTPTIPDLDDWHEALPAASVKSSNTQEARRSKNAIAQPTDEDFWNDRSVSTQPSSNPPTASLPARAIGSWTSILHQLRRILPLPIRQLSDAILTGIIVVIVTILIWVVDTAFVLPTEAQSTPITSTLAPISETPPQISPERAFIDTIQTQLADLTKEYPNDLIATLQVDLPQDLAIVKLTPTWYQLPDLEQDRLVDRMWLQAQSNHFSKLELQDIEGNSIARTPVVGQQMIIIKRKL